MTHVYGHVYMGIGKLYVYIQYVNDDHRLLHLCLHSQKPRTYVSIYSLQEPSSFEANLPVLSASTFDFLSTSFGIIYSSVRATNCSLL